MRSSQRISSRLDYKLASRKGRGRIHILRLEHIRVAGAVAVTVAAPTNTSLSHRKGSKNELTRLHGQKKTSPKTFYPYSDPVPAGKFDKDSTQALSVISCLCVKGPHRMKMVNNPDNPTKIK